MSSPLLQRANSSLGSGGYNSPKSLHRHGSSALGRRASISESPRAGSSGSLVEKPAQPQTSLEDIKRDETFSKFLADDFNATDFASQALHSGSAASSSRKLHEGILLLEKQLRAEVVNRHDELLTQVSSLKDTENVLAVVRAEVDSLRSSVQRVRNEIADPYKQIKLRTRQLAALHGTVELLRYVIRVLKLTGKLREQVESKNGRLDLAKAAQLYSEIDGIRKEADLGGVEAVEAEMGWLAEVGQRIRTEAMKSLEAGMESLNQAEVGSVLQVYYNMGELRQTVEQLLGKHRVQLTKAISAALDMKAISADQRAAPGPGGVARAGTPGLGTAPKAREALWQRMTACFETVHGVMVAVWHLQRVLAKKRDPITHVCFLTEAVPEGDPRPTERMWEAFTKVLANQMKSAFSASSFCKETFVNGYPKLAGMLDALLERLARDTDVKGVAPAVKPEDKASLSAAVEPFQNAYLAQSLKRMQEAVNTLFPQGMRASIPNSDQMSRLASGLLEELGAVQPDPTLTGLVMRGVATALQLLAERAEYQVATGPDARQVTGPATAAQMRNFAICHHLQELHAKLAAAIPALPSEATQAALGAALGAIHTVASEAVTPLFRAMVERIEALLLQIHDQAWGADVLADDVGGAAPANCSRYMEEVERGVLHFRQEFLSKLLVGTGPAKAGGVNTLGAEENIVLELSKRLASRILLVFVRHAALVRPLSEAGKLRLVRDISVLEFAVGEKLYPVEQLGAPYRAVRAFRPLLFLETDQFPTSPLLHELLPSTVLHHLLSRAPEELRSPHARANATPASYSSYMDDHSEEDIWKRIKASLDAYAQLVKARGDKEFSPIYPLMMSLGQSLLEDYASGAK